MDRLDSTRDRLSPGQHHAVDRYSVDARVLRDYRSDTYANKQFDLDTPVNPDNLILAQCAIRDKKLEVVKAALTLLKLDVNHRPENGRSVADEAQRLESRSEENREIWRYVRNFKTPTVTSRPEFDGWEFWRADTSLASTLVGAVFNNDEKRTIVALRAGAKPDQKCGTPSLSARDMVRCTGNHTLHNLLDTLTTRVLEGDEAAHNERANRALDAYRIGDNPRVNFNARVGPQGHLLQTALTLCERGDAQAIQFMDRIVQGTTIMTLLKIDPGLHQCIKAASTEAMLTLLAGALYQHIESLSRQGEEEKLQEILAQDTWKYVLVVDPDLSLCKSHCSNGVRKMLTNALCKQTLQSPDLDHERLQSVCRQGNLNELREHLSNQQYARNVLEKDPEFQQLVEVAVAAQQLEVVQLLIDVYENLSKKS